MCPSPKLKTKRRKNRNGTHTDEKLALVRQIKEASVAKFLLKVSALRALLIRVVAIG
jgi:hypothetical protein